MVLDGYESNVRYVRSNPYSYNDGGGNIRGIVQTSLTDGGSCIHVHNTISRYLTMNLTEDYSKSRSKYLPSMMKEVTVNLKNIS